MKRSAQVPSPKYAASCCLFVKMHFCKVWGTSTTGCRGERRPRPAGEESPLGGAGGVWPGLYSCFQKVFFFNYLLQAFVLLKHHLSKLSDCVADEVRQPVAAWVKPDLLPAVNHWNVGLAERREPKLYPHFHLYTLRAEPPAWSWSCSDVWTTCGNVFASHSFTNKFLVWATWALRHLRIFTSKPFNLPAADLTGRQIKWTMKD